MRSFTVLLFAVGAAMLVGSCANPQLDRAMAARQVLVGMPEAQLVSCAGVPVRTHVDGASEFMTFRTDRVESRVGLGASAATGGRVGFGTGFAVPMGTQTRYSSCEATVTLRDGIVRQVAYNTASGSGNSRFGQCAPIFQTCLDSLTAP